MDLFTYHPTIGYTFTANQKRRIPHESGGYLLQTDSLGFRNSKELSPDARNIFVFGDSFTAGDGVSNGKRWGDLIGGWFNDATVTNFGLSASGTDQQYLVWSEFCRDYRAALVIIAVLVENIRRNDARFSLIVTGEGEEKLKPKPYFDLDEAGNLQLGHNPVPPELRDPEETGLDDAETGGRFLTARRIVRRLGLRDQAQKLLRYQPLPEYRSRDTLSWRRTRAILERWVAEIDGPSVLVPIPIHQYVEETADAGACQERFAEFSRETGVPVIDPLPKLLRYSLEERRAFRFEHDVHFTEAGNRALAEAIGPELAAIAGTRQ